MQISDPILPACEAEGHNGRVEGDADSSPITLVSRHALTLDSMLKAVSESVNNDSLRSDKL